jgi:hypothetical protein
MSSGIEVIVLAPMIISALVQAGALLAGAAAGSVAAQQLAQAGAAAAEALAAMRREHEAALAELAQRGQEELADARERKVGEKEAATSARALAAMTQRRAVGGTRQMLAAGLAHIEERLGGLDPRPPDLDHAITDLRQRLEDAACDLAAALEQYQQLAARAAQAALEQAQRTAVDEKTAPVLALLAEMSVLLDSPVFTAPEGLAQHAELARKFAEVQRLAETQPKLAESMAVGLRTRILAALDELIARLKEQAARSEKLRENTGQLLSLLTALDGSGIPDAERTKAAVLRARLAYALVELDDEALAKTAEGLLGEARQLYAAVEQALASKVAQAVVGSQVVDVLSGLGYTVEQLDEPHSEAQHFHIALNAEAGMDVQLSANGLVKSELVAYAPLDEAAAQENEKLVCHVVDELLKQLHERKLDVRERFRTHFASGEGPRVVARTRKAGPRAAQREQLKRELPGDE